MPKPTRSATELQRMLLERIEQLPGLAGAQTPLHGAGIVGVDSDGDVANWTVRTTVPPSSWRLDVARVIRQLQLEFDMDAD